MHRVEVPHPLDRPVWASLTTHHRRLSEGDELARRFLRDVNLFASSRDDSPEALDALGKLVRSEETVFVLQVPEIVIPADLVQVRAATGVQMIATRPIAGEPVGGGDIRRLTEADAPEMLELATLTEPGPFLARTHTMGSFIGIRIDGRLAAMAGERMRFPGYTEVSGVCTHPDFRGRGLARRLSATVAASIQARGEQAFLHAWSTNTPAISLYETLGFKLRSAVNVSILRRGMTA
jgi:predicted GNAT family acetyltransferase